MLLETLVTSEQSNSLVWKYPNCLLWNSPNSHVQIIPNSECWENK